VLSVGSNFYRKSIWDLRVCLRFYPAPDHHIQLFIDKQRSVSLFDDLNIVHDSKFVQCNIIMRGMRNVHGVKAACFMSIILYIRY
jgi:hypothetical protein